MQQGRNTWQWRPKFFKAKVAQQDSKASEKPSRIKDNNTCINEENPPEKVQSTPHLVLNNDYLRPNLR